MTLVAFVVSIYSGYFYKGKLVLISPVASISKLFSWLHSGYSNLYCLGKKYLASINVQTIREYLYVRVHACICSFGKFFGKNNIKLYIIISQNHSQCIINSRANLSKPAAASLTVTT